MREDKQKATADKINRETLADAEAYLRNVKQRFLTGDLAQLHLSVTTSVVPHTYLTEIWKRVVEESERVSDIPGDAGCGIIAMATHGRDGFQHLFEGSITEQVLDATTRPLLVVHTQRTEE